MQASEQHAYRSFSAQTRHYINRPHSAVPAARLTGPGFVVVRGLPVTDWSAAEAEMAFWGIGHHLGIPGAQNPDQELLGHVRDYQEAASNPDVRLYRTAANIEYHCDTADVVGLLCLARARRGEHQPGTPPNAELTPCVYADGRLRTFYHSGYMRSVTRHAGVVLSPDHARLLHLYDERGADPDVQLDMWLQPGDMQFLCNHSIAHARTAYQDDPASPRHLLRIWLSLE